MNDQSNTKSQRKWASFPYARRAEEAWLAHEEAHRAFRVMNRRHDDTDPATKAWNSALERFRAAMAVVYPPGFWVAYENLPNGDQDSIEVAIAFLEADPWFFRSGYVKADLIRQLKRLPLSHDQASRLGQVVLNLVDQRDGREFRWYCRLARHIDGPDLRNQLERRLRDANGNVRRRAGWVLDVLGPDPAVRAKQSR